MNLGARSEEEKRIDHETKKTQLNIAFASVLGTVLFKDAVQGIPDEAKPELIEQMRKKLSTK